MARDVEVDAVVIGAGVMGSAIALELQRSGRRVVAVDKGEAVGGGSTSASSAVIRFTYSTVDGVIAAWEAMHRWVLWADYLGFTDGPVCQFHRIGKLHLPEPGYDAAPVLSHFDAVGVPYEMLDSAELARLYPALDTGCFHPPRLADDPQFFDPAHGEVEALYMPDGGFIDDPQLAATNLMDAARHHGAEVRLRRRVVEVTRSDDHVGGVVLDDGTSITAPVVVNAAGPWSSQINALAGVLDDMQITTRALRQDVAAAEAPAGFGVGDGGAVVGDMDLGTYSRPQPGGSYLIGGVEAPCDPMNWSEDPDADQVTSTAEMFETLVYRAARRIPALEVPLRPMGVASHYDVTEDWTPIYDRTRLKGYYLAIGTSGNQFKNAPVVGQILHDLIAACEAGHDHDVEPVQVQCHHTGQTLNLGTFSRNRRPASTSGTVMG
ncbi:MAG: FAD-binding oxidoreductase [Actinomycetia bacterium]|nr:FAD-binding oxidoreductase [Actinomycetes bacterium]